MNKKNKETKFSLPAMIILVLVSVISAWVHNETWWYIAFAIAMGCLGVFAYNMFSTHITSRAKRAFILRVLLLLGITLVTLPPMVYFIHRGYDVMDVIGVPFVVIMLIVILWFLGPIEKGSFRDKVSKILNGGE